jgi:hypothetical protein
MNDLSVSIWNGSSSFSPGQTPFGFYDDDSVFSSEADRVAKFCAVRLGYPLMSVELQSGSFYAAFEEAITVYGNEVYQWQVRENFGALNGASLPAGVTTLSDAVTTPNLGSIIRIAKNYGSEAGTGGTVNWYTGSIELTPYSQSYDLNAWAASSASLSLGDSIEIKRIFYEAPPAIARYFDPYAGTGLAYQGMMEEFGFGAYSPGITFMMMPLSFDVLRLQGIEFNDQIRRSGYSFEIENNQLRIFPIPSWNHKLYFQYVKISERDDSEITPATIVSGSTTINKISNISNVPYTNPVYSQINSIGKQWIYQYALAISKEMLGYVRNKYTNIPIPNDNVTLNGPDLISGATNDKAALLTSLRETLDQSSRFNYLTRMSQESDFIQKSLLGVPMPIYIG